jgi:serine/threonine-protein kinase
VEVVTESIRSCDIVAITEVPAPRIAAIGNFQILGELSVGGMGEVFVARTAGSRGRDELRAVKLIRDELAFRPNIRSMFQDECSLLSRIEHPGVTRVFGSGEESGALYLVMEYVAGIQVEELNRPLPPAIAVKMIADVCRALHAAHESTNAEGALLGIVHRDISPRNLMLTFDGHVKVIDFGIAFMHERVSRETQAGMLKGRPSYMAPEQFRSERVDRRTDVYSICVVLHELLTG